MPVLSTDELVHKLQKDFGYAVGIEPVPGVLATDGSFFMLKSQLHYRFCKHVREICDIDPFESMTPVTNWLFISCHYDYNRNGRWAGTVEIEGGNWHDITLAQWDTIRLVCAHASPDHWWLDIPKEIEYRIAMESCE